MDRETRRAQFEATVRETLEQLRLQAITEDQACETLVNEAEETFGQ